MKPLNLEETRLKEEMKSRCLNKGQYIDENAKAKFDMMCHLEDFEIQYWELERENQALKKQLEEKDILIKQCELSVSNVMDCYCERTDCSGRIKDNKKYDSLVQVQENQQKEFINWLIENESLDDYCNETTFTSVREKYKEIIGDDK